MNSLRDAFHNFILIQVLSLGIFGTKSPAIRSVRMLFTLCELLTHKGASRCDVYSPTFRMKCTAERIDELSLVSVSTEISVSLRFLGF